ncbi:hypothetical protein Syun_030683 [Stephania yunnanensis]|uniref:Uncharacterized protein n=1 Tax=Stephania yunnanensis TaxID=152371 RepID=A0AAP0DX79_9MAGN
MDYSYIVIRHRKICLEICAFWVIFHCCSPCVTPSFVGVLLHSTCHVPIGQQTPSKAVAPATPHHVAVVHSPAPLARVSS